MTPAAFAAETARLSTVLLEQGLAIAINTAKPTPLGGGVVSVSVPQASRSLDVDIDAPFHRIDEYRQLVEARAYMAVLRDGSLLQIAAAFRNNNLISHRYCFYPCPFDLEAIDLDPEMDLMDAVATFSAQDLVDQIRLLAPLRFEYSPNDAAPGHPASHAHLGASSCRVPVHAPISLGHFVRFVFCHFFPEEWQTCNELREWPVTFMDRTVTADEERAFYFESRRPGR